MTIYYRWNDLEKVRSSTQYLISSVQAHKIRSHPWHLQLLIAKQIFWYLLFLFLMKKSMIYHLQIYKIPNTICVTFIYD